MRWVAALMGLALACAVPVGADTETGSGSTTAPPPGYDPNNIDPCYQVGDGCNDNCHPRLVCVANEASWWKKVCAVPCNSDGTCNEGTCEGGVCLDKQGLAAGHCDGGEAALTSSENDP